MQHIYYRWPPRWNLKLKSHWFWNNLICYRDPVPQLVKLAKLHYSHPLWLPAPENHPPAPLLQSGNSTKGWSAPNLERRIRETSKYRSEPGSKFCCPDLCQALTQICQFTHPGPNTSDSEWQKLGEISLFQTNTNSGKVPTRFKTASFHFIHTHSAQWEKDSEKYNFPHTRALHWWAGNQWSYLVPQ